MEKGRRFSQVYIEKGDMLADSTRFRNRLFSVYYDVLTSYSEEIVRHIHNETGAKIPFVGSGFSIPSFFEKCETRDLLDSITLIFQLLKQKGTVSSSRWHDFVSRAFQEENLGYRLDEFGGVHFFIDQEFEQNRLSAIDGLGAFPNSLSAMQKAYSFLDGDVIDTTSAIRSTFEAVEILFKLVIDSKDKDRLNSNGIRHKLKPIIERKLGDKKIELTATSHMLDSMCDWVDAGHMYRHGQKAETPQPPSLDFAVVFISQGASYTRFLATQA